MLIKKTMYSLVVIICIFLAGCSSPEEKKERHYLKALEYIKQEDPKAAIIELKNAIQIDAKYADARYQLGLLYLKDKNAKGAFSELIRAADLDHGNIDANLKAAELYLISRNKEESRKRVERILAKDPVNMDALALLANLELIAGEFDKALAALDPLGEDIEKSDRLLNIKGRIYAAQEKWDDAENSFKKAIEVNSESFINYNNLLLLYQRSNKGEQAKSLLFKMAEQFPDTAQTHLLLAGYYRSMKEIDQEEQSLKKVIELAPTQSNYRLMLSNFYLTGGKQEMAENVLIEARETITDNPALGAALATLYFDAQKFDKAQQILDEISLTTPDHQGVKLLSARFLLKERKVRDAIEVLEKLTTDFPRWPEPFFYLGLARLAVGEVDLAQHAVATAIETNKNDPKYHTLMAQLFKVQGSFEDAKKEAAIALKINPKNKRAAFILLDAMIGLKEFDKAHKILTSMNEQLADDPEILGKLAITSLGMNDREGSINVLTKLLEIAPGNTRAVLLLIGLQYKQDLPAAERFVREQIEKAPESSGLQLLLGDILARQQKDEEALSAFEKAVEMDPNNIKAYVASGRLLVKLGKKDEAMGKYQSMIAQNPSWLQGYMGIAALFESDKNTTAAKEQYVKVLEISPDFAPAANNLAWIIASEPDGDMGEALRLAMVAKQALPDEPHIADTLGWVHSQRGSPTLAIPQFELALTGRPDDPTITYHLALALNQDGQKEKALKVVEALLEKDVEFPDKKDAEALLQTLRE